MKIRINILFYLTLLLFFTNKITAQNINPVIQVKIDSLNAWMQNQINTTGSVDQKKLDSFNNAIREAQNRISIEEGKIKINETVNGESGKLIIRDLMPGSVLVVPNDAVWKIKRVSCKTEIGGYSILVTSVKIKDEYKSGEQIRMPTFSSEASLLTDDTSSVIYTFEIYEIPKPK